MTTKRHIDWDLVPDDEPTPARAITSCKAVHPETGVECARSDWPGHAVLPHVWYRDRRSMEADNPTITWEDDEHRRPRPAPVVGGVTLPVLRDLTRDIFGR